MKKKLCQQLFIYLLCLLILIGYGCKYRLCISNSIFTNFDKSFIGEFELNSNKVNGKRYGDPNLLELFELGNINSPFVRINFKSESLMELTYFVNGVENKRSFSGIFIDRQYFEIYFRNEAKEIPPYFPILYGKHNINRLRIAVLKNGELIVDNFWNNSANLFIIGVGDKGRRLSFFLPYSKFK